MIKTAVDQVVKSADHQLARRDEEFRRWKAEAGKLIERLSKLVGDDGAGPHPAAAHVIRDETHVPNDVGRSPLSFPAADSAANGDDAGGAVADPQGRQRLTPTERGILDAAVTFPGGATKKQAAGHAGLSIKSSSFVKALAGGAGTEGKRPSLVQAGLLRIDGDRLIATEAGAAMARPGRAASLGAWKSKLTPTEGNVLECLARAYPRRMTRAEVSEASGQPMSSSSFVKAFPWLRGLGLIEGDDKSKTFAATPEIAASAQQETS